MANRRIAATQTRNNLIIDSLLFIGGITTATVRMGAGEPAPSQPPCTVVDNGTGTVDLPPDGCDYVSPEDLPTIRALRHKERAGLWRGLEAEAQKLLKPLGAIGLPVHELAMISVIALRFIPTLLDEARRIMKAQIGRGVSFEGGAVARARSAVPILIPLFASAFRRADDLALAMDARCYRGAQGRTKYVELKLKRCDGLAIVLLAVAAAAALAVPRWF